MRSYDLFCRIQIFLSLGLETLLFSKGIPALNYLAAIDKNKVDIFMIDWSKLLDFYQEFSSSKGSKQISSKLFVEVLLSCKKQNQSLI